MGYQIYVWGGGYCFTLLRKNNHNEHWAHIKEMFYLLGLPGDNYNSIGNTTCCITILAVFLCKGVMCLCAFKC